jgi:hypothetical protein
MTHQTYYTISIAGGSNGTTQAVSVGAGGVEIVFIVFVMETSNIISRFLASSEQSM